LGAYVKSERHKEEIRWYLMIVFKSVPDMWKKEKDGRKPNTFRRYRIDPRFSAKAGDYIKMVNTETGEAFKRKLTDVSFWDGYAIFSWEHPKKAPLSPGEDSRRWVNKRGGK